MNNALWFTQAFLAAVFSYSGWMKSTRTTRQLVAVGQTGVEHLPLPLIRFIGISELLGAIGLLVPWYTQLMPFLTPLAAFFLGLIMIPAGLIHYRRNEKQTVWVNIGLFLLCEFVAFERFL